MEIASTVTPIIESNAESGLGVAKSLSMKNDEKDESLSNFNKIYGSRESSDAWERPTSVRLESVLEYTNRIKAFLGFQDEGEEADTDVPRDSTADTTVPHDSTPDTKVPRDPIPDTKIQRDLTPTEYVDNNTYEEKNSENGVKTEAVISTDEKSSSDKIVHVENSELKSEDLVPDKKKINYPKLSLQPLPDIIEVHPDSLAEVEHEQFPDILERSKNFKIEESEDIFKNSPDNSNTTINSHSNHDLRDLETNSFNRDVSPQDEAVCEEPLMKSRSKSDITAVEINDILNNEDERISEQNNDTISKKSEKIYDALALEEKHDRIEGNLKSEEIQNEEDSDDENSYQITHIEEGLRQAEKGLKSTLPQEPEKQQTMFKYVPQETDELRTKDIPQESDEEQTKDIPRETDEQQTEDIPRERDEQQRKEIPTETDKQRTEDIPRERDEQQAKDIPPETDEQQTKDVLRDPNEQQTMFNEDVNLDNSGDTNQPQSLKRRSKLSMEDIRRLSTEVVNFVLQTAGDEVKVILRNRDSFTEDNKLLNATDAESSVDPEIILPLQDTEMIFNGEKISEASLADIPEEESFQTFSNKSGTISSAATSIAMKNIPVGSKHSIDRIEVTDEIDLDTRCGFGPFKPQCIQRYATANVYVVLYSIIGILHGSYYTYLVGVLTTLEKRFEFKSKTSGFIMVLDELTPLFLGVLVGHFGNRAHRPRLLSFGMFLSAFCCFASALPYFFYGTATHLSSIDNVHNKTSVEMCNGDVRIEHCDEDDRPPTETAILLLMLGSFLKGFGNLAYYAIGLAYLDDNAKKRNTPLYFAVAFALRLLGPMVGFLMSSAFLKYYENPFETPDFGPDDPRWIGGWWMGFVLQGVLLLIFAGPMALFPRRLQGHTPLLHEIEHNSNSMFEGLGDSLKRLGRNPLYMLIGLNTIFTVYGNFGYYIMLPKYMENQFRLSASSASLFAGPPGIAALMVSCVIGGYLIWKFKPTVKFLAGGLVTLELISTLGYLILMIPQCEKIEMTHFGFGEESLILEQACNANCSCSTVSFTPVCGPDGRSYFSPCYAGCTYQQDQSFYNCSCVEGNAVVTKGICSSESCWSQALAYIVTVPVLQFVENILRVAYTMIMFRSIKPEDKNIALGAFETVLSTVAFIPFPILYGALVDSACLVWEKSCGETGNCWFYDIQKFNYLMHGSSAFFCGLSTLNLVAIFFLSNRIKNLYKDEDEETEDSREKKTNTKL